MYVSFIISQPPTAFPGIGTTTCLSLTCQRASHRAWPIANGVHPYQPIHWSWVCQHKDGKPTGRAVTRRRQRKKREASGASLGTVPETVQQSHSSLCTLWVSQGRTECWALEPHLRKPQPYSTPTLVLTHAHTRPHLLPSVSPRTKMIVEEHTSSLSSGSSIDAHLSLNN